jgi:hypothetical protein
MILAVAVSFGAAAVQQSSVQIGPLNHNDVYHLIQLFGNWLFYQGAGELRDG